VNKVVPAEALEGEAWQAAQTLANVSPFAAQHMKRSINQTLDKMGWHDAFEHHLVMRAWEGQVPGVPEKEELNRIRDEQGLRAFLEHRDTFFQGRELYGG
jgi:enoyl-CoA hydratase/carnithine racemase